MLLWLAHLPPHSKGPVGGGGGRALMALQGRLFRSAIVPKMKEYRWSMIEQACRFYGSDPIAKILYVSW